MVHNPHNKPEKPEKRKRMSESVSEFFLSMFVVVGAFFFKDCRANVCCALF